MPTQTFNVQARIGLKDLGFMPKVVVKGITQNLMDSKQGKEWRLMLLNLLRDVGRVGVKAFQEPTATWRKQPKIVMKRDVRRVAVIVGSNDKVLTILNQGAEKKTRRNKMDGQLHRNSAGRLTHAAYLRFRPGFTSKTRPRSLKARTGARVGSWVYARSVRTGVKPRKFTDLVADRMRDWLIKNRDKFLNRLLNKIIEKRGTRRVRFVF